MSEKFDVAVIGSGPGGYSAAIRCAQKGAKVAIFEKADVGGTCLNCGCIPSKVLLASAHTLLMVKHAAMMGIDIASAIPNWPKIQARKNAIVTGFQKGLAGLIKSNRIQLIGSRATVTAPRHIAVESGEIEAEKIILATGSQPIEIPNIQFDGQTVISSKEALSLEQVPASMVIIGGGVIGCEMACVYAAMGTKITIIEALDRLIPMEDPWVGQLLSREFKKLGIDVLTSQKVTSVDKTNGLANVNTESGQTLEAEKVLVSVGRNANCDAETIEALGLEMKDTTIKVNSKLQTSASDVYAIGDAVGTTYLAHGAFAEAEVAAANATGGSEEISDYSLIPRAVYTFPEIASVGRNEQTCKEQGLDISVGRSFFKANGRSNAHNDTVGEIRVITDNNTNKILGATMVGGMVTELAAAATGLINSTQKIADISFAHPTVSEVLKEAAEDALGLSLHNPPKPA